jgi:hypothetical protein
MVDKIFDNAAQFLLRDWPRLFALTGTGCHSQLYHPARIKSLIYINLQTDLSSGHIQEIVSNPQ